MLRVLHDSTSLQEGYYLIEQGTDLECLHVRMVVEGWLHHTIVSARLGYIQSSWN